MNGGGLPRASIFEVGTIPERSMSGRPELFICRFLREGSKHEIRVSCTTRVEND